jgi:5-methylcytosine-specific restriction endonuclease McrA
MVHVDAPAIGDDGQQAVVEVGGCPVDVSAETSRRLTCDASVVAMRYDEQGTVLDVGRKTRTIPGAIRRALAARDTRCQFPGCTARRCDAHHVVHWADGGVTALDNLVLLCRRHHRLLHEGGYTVGRDVAGILRFVRPNGYPLECVPAPPPWTASTAPLGPTVDRLAAAGIEIGRHAAPLWDGTPFNVGVVIDALRGNEPLERTAPEFRGSPPQDAAVPTVR